MVEKITPQELGKIGERIIKDILIEEYSLKEEQIKHKSRDKKGCDFEFKFNDKTIKIEVKTVSREKGIPDAHFNEFVNFENPRFNPDFLYLVRIVDLNSMKADIICLTREQVNEGYNHKPKKIVVFDSKLKTDIKNGKKFKSSTKLRIDISRYL